MISWYIDSNCISGNTPRGRDTEEALGCPDAVGQGVDVVVAGVHVEGGPRGRRDAVAAHDRPGAVVAHPDLDTEVVEHLTDVVRVDALDGEGDRAATGDGVGRADHRDAGDRGQL